MELAAQGYPSTGISYDIFQNASGLGVTEMEKQTYYKFQLEENLRRTINKMEKIKDSVVRWTSAKQLICAVGKQVAGHGFGVCDAQGREVR